jgi:acetyltransferase-like isoleucine patch superfamily enzyme
MMGKDGQVNGVEPIIVVGGGSETFAILEIVDAVNAVEHTFDVTAIVGDAAEAAGHDLRYVLAAVDPNERAARDELLSALGLDPVPLLRHPASTFGSDLRIGPGAVIAAGVRVTTNVETGRHLRVGADSTLSHDGVYGDYVTLDEKVNVAGNVTVGDRVWFHSGGIVIPGRSIGSGATVESGAVIVHDVAADTVVAGVPARPVDR